ncbi:MAG: PD-(D/E)XK nuclease family protein, partial [Clostridia bacterium]|nr:PD-(D/E)XK nuclease family protein [Clostridia bacterium]
LHLSYFDEEMRMLYVALTRARKKLYVSSQLKDFDKALSDARLIATVPHYYTFVRKASYIHWILTALATESELEPKYCIINKTQADVLLESENVIKTKIRTKSEADTLSNEDKEKLLNATRSKLSYVYPFLSSLKLPSKLSVSRLYPEILDEETYFGVKDVFEKETVTAESDNASLLKAPAFTLNSKQASGAERGTATHVFMQFCDFNKLEANGIESEIDRLTEKRFILKEHAEMIDRSAIEKFLKSDCFRTIKNASEINREYRFNIKLRASEFTATPELKAELMDDFVFVQGIIDCYIRDKSGDIILIDYKTDAVPKSVIGNKDAENDFFTERHGEQLRYYRTALKLLTGKEVKRTFIYSFALCREIEINN